MQIHPLGAHVMAGATRFTVWAPEARVAQLQLHEPQRVVELHHDESGLFVAEVPGVGAGALYRFSLDGGPPMPDPASRFQPQGVHGPSQVVDPHAYSWNDAAWTGVPRRDWVIYELHVGTFTPAGTFAGVQEQLPYLRDMGITAIELMPLADFPGRWNWGYDPAALYAPCRAYGQPDDLRALVDAAHGCGIAVILDAVYNHFGPDGAYAPAFAKAFLNDAHRTAWGAAINLDGPRARGVRSFFIDNALHWLREYHFDGLRLDATHALQDTSHPHFLAELSDHVASLPGPRRFLIGEDSRNLSRLVQPTEQGGYGLDGVWIDDFHHQIHCTLTAESEGYYEDYKPDAATVGRVVDVGWLYTGQVSKHLGVPRGTEPRGVRTEQLVYCLQNHDQVGNRAQGDRLSLLVSDAQYRAASALLLFLPQTPLLFMGQEWGARTPFLFFTDHNATLGPQVSAGRQAEFSHFGGFAQGVPDPQDPATFARSHLCWDDLKTPYYRGMLQFYRDLLARRRTLTGPVATTYGDRLSLVLRRGRHLLAVALHDDVTVPIPADAQVIWHSEHPAYCSDSAPPLVQPGGLYCRRAAAALFESAA